MNRIWVMLSLAVIMLTVYAALGWWAFTACSRPLSEYVSTPTVPHTARST